MEWHEAMVMTGWVEFVEGGVTLFAILDDVGRWNCEAAPHIAAALNRDCTPAGDPGDDAWGHDALIKAALRLHGFAWLSSGRLTN